jgi:hypothetical protein
MRRVRLISGIVLLATSVGRGLDGQSLDSSRQLALVGGTVYRSPAQPPLRNGVILIEMGGCGDAPCR